MSIGMHFGGDPSAWQCQCFHTYYLLKWWSSIQLAIHHLSLQNKGQKDVKISLFSCLGGAFSSDSGLCHFWAPLWGTGIILLSCDWLTLKRDCETIKGSICLVSTSLPEGSQCEPLSCWNPGKGGQREKVNIHLKTSANISEYYPTTLLANCTNHFGKCLFFFLLTPTTFSFPKALYPFVLPNVCMQTSPASVLCIIVLSTSLSNNTFSAVSHHIFICLQAL